MQYITDVHKFIKGTGYREWKTKAQLKQEEEFN